MTEGSPVATRSGSPRLEALLALVVAVAVTGRYASVDHALFWDEYYHLLAARSWAQDGTLAIADGLYERAWPYTMAVGAVFRAVGESLLVAKLLSASIATALAVAVFLWTRASVGRAAAWIATLLLVTSPITLHVSGMVRFYGLQALLFWLGATSLHGALTGTRSRRGRGLLLAAAVVLLIAAQRLTLLTATGLAGLLLWVALLALWRAGQARSRAALLTAVGLIAVASLAVAVVTGSPAEWMKLAGWSPSWGEGATGETRFYHWLLLRHYPTLWTLMPLALLIGLRRHAAAVTLCATVLISVLGLLTLSEAKAERYAAFVMPFFYVVWGVALAEVWPWLRERVADAIAVARGDGRTETRATRALGTAGAAAVCAFALLANPGFHRAARMLSGPEGEALTPTMWEEAGGALRPSLDRAEVVVTPNPLHALYFLGRSDYDLGGTDLVEVQPPEEFGIDLRTGRPVLSSAASLRTLLDGYATGLVVSERWRWNSAQYGPSQAARAFVEAELDEVPLPSDLGLVAFHWGLPDA